ncbi:unnamed protein product [Heterobilharzia americana]|nr:unnamed protein product [Heterobilharzia americana]
MEKNISSLKSQLIDAENRLLTHLKSHHNLRPARTDFLVLVSDFEELGRKSQFLYENAREKVIPRLKSVQCNLINKGDNRVSSASAVHQDAVSQLQELLDMHANCFYLLKLHEALVSLESSVYHLFSQCSSLSTVDHKENCVDFIGDNKSKGKTNILLEHTEIGETTYRLCVNTIIQSLETVEDLFSQQTKFNKDSLLIFQDFLKTYTRCKDMLAQHVDEFWSRWFILEVPSKQRNDDDPFLPSVNQTQSDDFFSFLLDPCIRPPADMHKILTQEDPLLDSSFYHLSDYGEPTTQAYEQSSIMASLKILAKPELVSQLLYIIEALKESKGRIYQLSYQIWTYFFKPWLRKAPCVSGSGMGWPELKCQVLEEFDEHECNHNLFVGDKNTPASLVHVTPYLHVSLIAPTDIDKHKNEDYVESPEDGLVPSSCAQLTDAFQELYTYFFGLYITRTSSKGSKSKNTGKRIIDLVINDNSVDSGSGMFNNELVKELIDGRFTAGLPSARELDKSEVITPLTLFILQLIGVGRTTGFLTDETTPIKEQKHDSNPLKLSTTGGATKLSLWIDNLSILKHKRSANLILDKLRQLLADRTLFYSICPGNDETNHLSCKKKISTGSTSANNYDGAGDDYDDDGIFQEDEIILGDDDGYDLSDLTNTDEIDKCDQILSRLLKSKCNLNNISRYLDMGHFDFPKCMVSETVILIMKQVYEILKNAEAYLEPLINEVNQSLTYDDPKILKSMITNIIVFIDSIIKLVPRIFMLFTSLIPTLHADIFEEDLRFAVLYHNNCMYLAHECLTLSERGLFKFVERFLELNHAVVTDTIDISNNFSVLERSASMSTCILVPHLRQAGVNSLLSHLRRERQFLLQCTERIQGFCDVNSSAGYHRCTSAIRDICVHFRKITDALDLLPYTIYIRAIGVLCNCVCAELVKSVLKLIDITKSDCDSILILLEPIRNVIIDLFQNYNNEQKYQSVVEEKGDRVQKDSDTGSLFRRCPEFQRLQGVISVLSASSMAEIRDILWDNGKGPLSTEAHITATELRCLIKALYSSSSVRDQLLQKLH